MLTSDRGGDGPRPGPPRGPSRPPRGPRRALGRRGAASVARALAALAGLAALGAGAPEAKAQGFELIPQVGSFVPLNDLGRMEGAGGAVSLGRREAALALGLAAELGARGPVSLRGSLLFGTSAELPLEGAGCAGCRASSHLLVAGAALLVRPATSLSLVRPYLLAGAAAKRHGVDDDELRASGFPRVAGGASSTAVHLGAGLELGLGLIDAVVELSDYVSRFEAGGGEGGLQNDLFLMVGLRL